MNPRIGLASIKQETNTFAPRLTTMDDFVRQGWWEGREALIRLEGTNTEIAGAAEAVVQAGAEPVPLIRAYALASGRVSEGAFLRLKRALGEALDRAGRLDALFLSLHGAMAAEGEDDSDAALAELARHVMGSAPIGISLDFHANVTTRLMSAANLVIGFHTYPHTDQRAVGGRVAALLASTLKGHRRPTSSLVKRPLVLPAETTQTTYGPMHGIRRRADSHTVEPVLDVSLFVVQPWLDVADLGIGVVVTTDGDEPLATRTAERMADEIVTTRPDFRVQLTHPAAAVRAVRESERKPMLLIESADSPTAGAAGDSPAMLRCLLEEAPDLKSYVTLVDAPAVSECLEAGVGASKHLRVGCSIDARYHAPVQFVAEVVRTGSSPVVLSGPVATGMPVSMGRWAVVRSSNLEVLLTEEPAHTYDPVTFQAVGWAPEEADIIVVRSANAFRAGYGEMASGALVLDLPGASTPRIDMLPYTRAPEPLSPIS